MIEICNASVYQQQGSFYGTGWQALADFAHAHHMNGVELLIDTVTPPADIPAGLVYGVHLPIWITWLDMWRAIPNTLERYYAGEVAWAERYAGGTTPETMLRSLASQLEIVNGIGAAYAVVHAAHVEFSHSFNRAFTYSNREVLDAFAAVLNGVAAMFGGEPPVRLFIENVWWPGLTFVDPTMADYLMERLTFRNWAFVLDTAHLLNTNHAVRTEADAIAYLLERVHALSPAVRDRIEAVHLNLSMSGNYQHDSIAAGVPDGFETLPFGERFTLARDHVGQIDQHLPFTSPDIRRLIDAIAPQVVVHELAAYTLDGFASNLDTQYRALHVGN